MAQDLPEWVEDALEFDNRRELQQRPVAEIFVHGDRPYYNLRRVRAELKGNFDEDTVRSRIRELVQQGVLKSEPMNTGDIYWLDRDESDWPIPPDVTVEPVNDEMTVSEFFNQTYVQIGILSVLGIVIASLIVWIGTLLSADLISLPIDATSVLAGGLTTMLVCYFGIVLAVGVWMLDRGSADFHELR